MQEVYYFLREKDSGAFLKGTKNWGKCPPKLYSFGSAKQVQSFKEKAYKRQYELVPVKVTYDE